MEHNAIVETAEYVWRPLRTFGFSNPFFNLNPVTIINTWACLALLAALIIAVRLLFFHHQILRTITTTIVSTFSDYANQTLEKTSFNHLSFMFSLFIFIFVANTLCLVPFLVEPTTDFNTTLALSVIVFFYIQYHAIKQQGIVHYGAEFFSPIFVMFPIHVMGKLGTIVSMSFRLFGNIFGGATIMHIYTQAIGGSLPLEILGIACNSILVLFFGLFEGLIQAFVFTTLSITYLSLALRPPDDDETASHQHLQAPPQPRATP
jgi:F-type H+-transporting ATPase subunit a